MSISYTKLTSKPLIRNWGYLENWKSTGIR